MQRFEYKLVKLWLGDRQYLDDPAFNGNLFDAAKDGWVVKAICGDSNSYALMERPVAAPDGICGACQGSCPAGDYLCGACRA